MGTPAPRAREVFADELRVFLPAILVTVLVAFLLRHTGLSPGARLGASFFVFLMLQPFFRRITTGRSIGGLGWAFTTIVATIMGMTGWYLIDN